MELWIRSQDKTTIIKCNELYMEETDSFLIRERNSTHILGAYITFDRALKILDEIQDILDTKKSYEKFAHLITKDTKVIEFSNVIYEMPKE